MEQPQRVYLSLHACLLFHWGNNQRDFLLWSGGLISFQHSPQLLTSKEFKLHTVYFGTLEHIKPLQLVGQAAEFRFESKFNLCLSSDNHSKFKFEFQRLFQKTIEGFGSKINGWALGAELRHSLRGLDWWDQTQGISKLVAVAAGTERQAHLRKTCSLVMLIQFKNQKVLMPCGYWAAKSHLFLCKMKFLMELARYCCRPASPID